MGELLPEGTGLVPGKNPGPGVSGLGVAELGGRKKGVTAELGGLAARQKREALSSDEDGEDEVVMSGRGRGRSRGGGVAETLATRPRQRSLKRNKKVGFTNLLTSDQLVSHISVV